jgi:transcriptional regulator
VYTPPLFRLDDPGRAVSLMRKNPFAVVVSTSDAGLAATHLPLLVRDAGRIDGHMARANPHWRTLDGARVLVIFSGAQAYVSPSFYARPDDNVPTWSYAAVHAHGRARVFHEPGRLRALLTDQVRTFEEGLDRPWSMERAAAKIERLLGGIVGMEIEVERLEAKMKVGQNRDADDRASAAAALAAQPDEGSRQIAAWMRELGLA